MPTLEKLNAILKEQKRDDQEIALVRHAYDFADTIHHGVPRVSGVPYIEHPLAVAIRLALMHMPPRVVVAGLLHDTVEDTTRPQEEVRAELRKQFGDDIADMVDRVTKLRFTKNANAWIRIEGVDRYIENLRKMFIAFANDLRVIIIKFADRIENLKDLEVLPHEKKLRVALETLELYAPIANRLGMGQIRVELEDGAFRHALPNEYAQVSELIGDKYKHREGYLERIAATVNTRLSEAGIKSIISLQARTKHYYSVYKKLLRYDWDINRIWDIFALRIIAEDIPNCYAALGVIHSIWKPVKGRIKDYISQPKPNGYRSIHTTVFCDDGEFVEFQIRTKEMHEEAEYGVTAHWRYDEKKGTTPVPSKHIDWVQELVSIHKEIQDNKSFLEHLEHMKIDIFKDRIFVHTPKGDVIELPENATAVDFAYAIHSDLGNTCVGAVVNEKNVPLDTPLHSGDVVKVLVDKKRKGPSSDWLKFVKTRHAREKIKEGAKSPLLDFLKLMVPKGRKK